MGPLKLFTNFYVQVDFSEKRVQACHVLKKAMTSKRLRTTTLMAVDASKLGSFQNFSAVAEKHNRFILHEVVRDKGTKTAEGQKAETAGGGALPLETRKPTTAIRDVRGLGAEEGYLRALK